MKRIYQNVAVETLCYSMNPFQQIKIIDRKSTYDTGVEVFNDTCENLNSFEHSKICRSEVHGIRAKDNVLIITIETVNDHY